MQEFLNFILDVIRVDFLIGFGLYSILYFITVKLKRNSASIKEFDGYACRTVIYLGIVYFFVWISAIVLFYIQADEGEKNWLLNRMFGPYWFGFYLQPLFWIGLTQLLRFKRLQKLILYRVVMSLLFVLTFERYVILVTSLERDYFQSSWAWINISGIEIFIGLTMKVLAFIVLAGICYLISKKIKGSQKTFLS